MGTQKRWDLKTSQRGTLKLEFRRQKSNKWDSRTGNSIKQKEIIPCSRRESRNKLSEGFIYLHKISNTFSAHCYILSHFCTWILSLNKYLLNQRLC